MTAALTAPQRKALEGANHLGLIEWRGTRGLAAAGWERMMERLCDAGFVRPYRHGGYEITDVGRIELGPRSIGLQRASARGGGIAMTTEIASRAVPAGGSRPDADGERGAVVALPREGLAATPRPDRVLTIGQMALICAAAIAGAIAIAEALLIVALRPQLLAPIHLFGSSP